MGSICLPCFMWRRARVTWKRSLATRIPPTTHPQSPIPNFPDYHHRYIQYMFNKLERGSNKLLWKKLYRLIGKFKWYALLSPADDMIGNNTVEDKIASVRVRSK